MPAIYAVLSQQQLNTHQQQLNTHQQQLNDDQQQLITELRSELEVVSTKLAAQSSRISAVEANVPEWAKVRAKVDVVEADLVSEVLQRKVQVGEIGEQLQKHKQAFDQFKTDRTLFGFETAFGRPPEFYLDSGRLNLNKKCDTIHKVRAVENMLTANTPIEGWDGRVSLGRNNIGDEWGKYIAERMKISTSLTKVDLGHNSIGRKERTTLVKE